MQFWEVTCVEESLLIGGCQLTGLWGASSPFGWHAPILASQEQLALGRLNVSIEVIAYWPLLDHVTCCSVALKSVSFMDIVISKPKNTIKSMKLPTQNSLITKYSSLSPQFRNIESVLYVDHLVTLPNKITPLHPCKRVFSPRDVETLSIYQMIWHTFVCKI